MEYNCETINNEYSDTQEKSNEMSEIEQEVIVCQDENLMQYLVEITEILLESIWRSSQMVQPRLCPLNEYLSHVIRQSKISLYTLKCSIIYFIRISKQLQDPRWKSKIRLFCGRRMFLGSVIIASKYLYDRTYSNSMWAKILGLDIIEVNNIQMDFLEALNYDLYISKELDSIWSQMLENFIAYLKVRHERKEKIKEEGKEGEVEDSYIYENNILASPLNSPALSSKLVNKSQILQNFPKSPISPAILSKNLHLNLNLKQKLTSNNQVVIDGDDDDDDDDDVNELSLNKSSSLTIITTEQKTNSSYPLSMTTSSPSLSPSPTPTPTPTSCNQHHLKNNPNNNLNDNYNNELKKLEEYRPFVKVLMQVIFIYSKNNSLPVGEKKIIKLSKLATTPDQLFINSYHPHQPFLSSMNPIYYPNVKYYNYGNDYVMGTNMNSHRFSLYQMKKHFSTFNKLNKSKKLQLMHYNFNKIFPNHHLFMNAYRRQQHANISGYYSDSSMNSKHSTTFHPFKGRINYQRIKEVNDRLCYLNKNDIGNKNENENENENGNTNKNEIRNGNGSEMKSIGVSINENVNVNVNKNNTENESSPKEYIKTGLADYTTSSFDANGQQRSVIMNNNHYQLNRNYQPIKNACHLNNATYLTSASTSTSTSTLTATSISTSSSTSDWDSVFDDGSTLIGSSNVGSANDSDQDNTPKPYKSLAGMIEPITNIDNSISMNASTSSYVEKENKSNETFKFNPSLALYIL